MENEPNSDPAAGGESDAQNEHQTITEILARLVDTGQTELARRILRDIRALPEEYLDRERKCGEEMAADAKEADAARVWLWLARIFQAEQIRRRVGGEFDAEELERLCGLEGA